jgi:hypothetical protein
MRSVNEVRHIACARQKALRPMTDDEKRMATSLKHIVFALGEAALPRKLAVTALDPAARITEAEASSLRSLVVRYRRDLPAEILALAGPQGEATMMKVMG